jgi:hypothetical protein
MQPECGVSFTQILDNPGHTGANRAQIHAAMFSLVGFSRPATSLRQW